MTQHRIHHTTSTSNGNGDDWRAAGNDRFYSLDGLNILIVDDYFYMVKLVAGILTSFRAKEVQVATSVRDAEEKLGCFNADLIITDWEMESISGLEFVRHLRAGEVSAKPDVPVIMLTGYIELDRIKEARDAGVTEFLAKPFTPLSLYSRILSVIENPRSFIKAKDYVGPDRRRKNVQFVGDERRASDLTVRSRAAG